MQTPPEVPDLPHRELPVAPNGFLQRIVEGTVCIVAVWHARQRPGRPVES